MFCYFKSLDLFCEKKLLKISYMSKKIFLLAVALLMTVRLIIAQEPYLISLSADGIETSYSLSSVQKIVFENSTMTVNMKSGNDITDIMRVRFSMFPVRIENQKFESSIFVFPNPVKTNLSIVGCDNNVRINLFDMNGKLLRSIFSHEKSTDIDVSSLQQGIYILQVGDQIIKIVKQ